MVSSLAMAFLLVRLRVNTYEFMHNHSVVSVCDYVRDAGSNGSTTNDLGVAEWPRCHYDPSHGLAMLNVPSALCASCYEDIEEENTINYEDTDFTSFTGSELIDVPFLGRTIGE